jgi:hypothetical protein
MFDTGTARSALVMTALAAALTFTVTPATGRTVDRFPDNGAATEDFSALRAAASADHPTGAFSPGRATTPPPTWTSPQARTSPRQAAERALARVEAVLTRRDGRDQDQVRSAGGVSDLTMLLRDLARALPHLGRSDRVRARSLLARPTDGAADPAGFGYPVPSRSLCGTTLCLHWVDSSAHAPAAVDGNLNGIPDQAETSLAVAEQALGTLTVTLGYRPPLSDAAAANPGPDGRLDVYLADTGSVSLFGYCAPDDPAQLTSRQVAAYCVLDNDFAVAQFPATDPVGSLQVTAAHELFHAVQFGYDWTEDLWLMEGTAAWVEDVVYDDVNDNVRYVPASALAQPHHPVDSSDRDRRYGAWVFWQFLTERFGTTAAADPTIIRQVWEGTAPPTDPDRHSLEALSAALWHRDTTIPRVFGEFAALAQVARLWYFEGANLVNVTIDKQHRLSPRRPRTGWWSAKLDHLTFATSSFKPDRSLPRAAMLRLRLDLPGRRRGSTATVAVYKQSGRVQFSQVRLSASGGARFTLPFSRSRKVHKVVLTVANGSPRVACGHGTEFTCGGRSPDDLLPFSYSAEVVRR